MRSLENYVYDENGSQEIWCVPIEVQLKQGMNPPHSLLPSSRRQSVRKTSENPTSIPSLITTPLVGGVDEIHPRREYQNAASLLQRDRSL